MDVYFLTVTLAQETHSPGLCRGAAVPLKVAEVRVAPSTAVDNAPF